MGESKRVLTMRSSVQFSAAHNSYFGTVALCYELPNGAKSEWSCEGLRELPEPYGLLAWFKSPKQALEWIDGLAKFAAYCGASIVPTAQPDSGTNLAQTPGGSDEKPKATSGI